MLLSLCNNYYTTGLSAVPTDKHILRYNLPYFTELFKRFYMKQYFSKNKTANTIITGLTFFLFPQMRFSTT